MLSMNSKDVIGVGAHTLLEQGRVNMSERAVALYAMLFSRKRLPPNSSGLYRTRRPSQWPQQPQQHRCPSGLQANHDLGLHREIAVRWEKHGAAAVLLVLIQALPTIDGRCCNYQACARSCML